MRYIEEKLVVFFPLGKMRQCTVCCENLREMRGLLTVWHAWNDEPKNIENTVGKGWVDFKLKKLGAKILLKKLHPLK